MSVEYLLVVYKQDRDVPADDDRVGVTNHTILLAPDEYDAANATPAKAGAHPSSAQQADLWIPAFAGKAQRLLLDLNSRSGPPEPAMCEKAARSRKTRFLDGRHL